MTDRTLHHVDLARSIFTWFGRAISPSREPGADEAVDRLSEKLAQWLPNIDAAIVQPEQAAAYVTAIEEGKVLLLPRQSLNTAGLVALYAQQAAQVVPDVDDLRDRLVAISKAVADGDDRVAQAMLGEILRALASLQGEMP